MIITCEECSTRFNLDESILKPEGSKVRCSLCRHVFTAFPPAPLPPVAAEEEIQFETPSQASEFDDNELDFEDTDFEIDDLDFETDETGLDTVLDMDETGLDMDETGLGMEAARPGSANIEISFDPESEMPEFEEDALTFDDTDIKFDDPDTGNEASADLTDFDSMEFESLDQEALSRETAAEPDLFLEADLNSDPAFDETEQSLDMDMPEADLSFDDDPDADLVFEETGPAEPVQDDLDLAFEMEETDDQNLAFPDLTMETEDPPADEADLDLVFGEDSFEPLDPTVDENALEEMTDPVEDDFSAYDQALDQETEPEDHFQDQDDETVETDGTEDRRVESEPEPLMESLNAGSPELYSGQPRTQRKKSSMGPPVMVLMLLFIIVAAAYIASLTLGYKIPFLSDVQIPFLENIFKKEMPAKPAPKPVPNEGSVNGRFISNDTAGELFVITGQVENPAAIPYSHIQVKGTLITKDKAKAKTQIVFCGNVIAEEMLKSGNISDISKQLAVREGMNNLNVNVKPGGVVPFMLVFSSLPDNLENFTVEVVGF